MSFHGATVVTLDVKGRLAIPTRYRDALRASGTEVVLTAHPDGCVLLYPEVNWEPVREKVQGFPAFHAQASWWKRLLLGLEEHLRPDSAGRVLLPPALRIHGRLDRDVMMVGQGAYFELWDRAVWDAKLATALAGSGATPLGMEDFSL